MSEMRQRPLDDSVFDIRRAHGWRNILRQRVRRIRERSRLLRLHAPFLRLPLAGRHCPTSNSDPSNL